MILYRNQTEIVERRSSRSDSVNLMPIFRRRGLYACLFCNFLFSLWSQKETVHTVNPTTAWKKSEKQQKSLKYFSNRTYTEILLKVILLFFLCCRFSVWVFTSLLRNDERIRWTEIPNVFVAKTNLMKYFRGDYKLRTFLFFLNNFGIFCISFEISISITYKWFFKFLCWKRKFSWDVGSK